MCVCVRERERERERDLEVVAQSNSTDTMALCRKEFQLLTHHNFPHTISFHTNMSVRNGRAGQDHIWYSRTETEQSVGVVRGVNLVTQREVGQMIDIDSVLQRHSNSIASQLDTQNDLSEAQFSNGLLDVIVPNKDTVGGSVGMERAATDECNEIATEQHLDGTDATVQTAFHRSLERMDLEDLEALGGAKCYATAILVKGAAQHLLLLLLLLT